MLRQATIALVVTAVAGLFFPNSVASDAPEWDKFLAGDCIVLDSPPLILCQITECEDPFPASERWRSPEGPQRSNRVEPVAIFLPITTPIGAVVIVAFEFTSSECDPHPPDPTHSGSAED